MSVSKTIVIRLERMEFHSFHGVFEQENRVGARYQVDLSVRVPVSSSMRRDSLEGTVSYADIFEEVKRQMSVPSALIEHVAIRIAETLQEKFPQIEGGRVSIGKCRPPVAGMIGSASVELEF